jgi:hypothetical protein
VDWGSEAGDAEENEKGKKAEAIKENKRTLFFLIITFLPL